MDALSAKNYQDISKLASLPDHLVLWDARLKILEADYAGAQSQLVGIRDSDRFASHNFSRSFIDLEIAYCEAMLGDLTAIQSLPISSAEFAFENFDVDEQLVAAWMKVRLADLNGHLFNREAAQLRVDQCAHSYQSMMDRLADQLTDFIG